ncbi:VOC family protein [Streptomyces sp. CBMA152]|uniref:VOC family protein n=1 Tax=Streptomyces sp. CBMA152 TaxID=1896312 RepID=UPI00166187A0|nr:VOC family protein [Streptomyces sp. CBMA152]MBD0742682.1 glyoxalase [Streptomyces sp. CBMA152]
MTTATTTRAPGLSAVHHIAFTVPDLDEAVVFFTEVLGAETAYRTGPIATPDSDWMHRHLGVHPRSTAHIAMLRLGPTLNLELFEYTGPGRRERMPGNSDWGGHHLAFWTDDFDACIRHLAATPGVRVLGEPEQVGEGPIRGTRWVYFTTPWGQHLELVHAPDHQPYQDHTDVRLYQPQAPHEGRGT